MKKETKMFNKTVLLGMSGGVDSSLAALLLQKQGYKVIGAFIKSFSQTKNKLTGECAWRDERKVALKIAYQLKIPLITLDFEKEYKKEIIDPMFRDYKRGITPNPDILCNQIIKFPLLYKAAKKLNADYIATGHYARIKKTATGFKLLKGKDQEKDQSYFLASLTQNDLSHTLFPLGNLNKKKVRLLAKNQKFSNWDKQGTRGICFVGKMNMQDFLRQRIKEKKGEVFLPDGKKIGSHKGIMFYTIGQKAGEHIGITLQKPIGTAQQRYYICDKKKPNILIVAPEGHPALKKKIILLAKIHFINPNSSLPKGRIKVKLRYRAKDKSGKIEKKGNQYIFKSEVGLEGTAPGQYAVFYKNEEVIGCAQIKKTMRHLALKGEV